MSYWLTLFVLAVCSLPFVLLLLLGAYALVQASRAERTFFPVQAVVLSKSISEDVGSTGDGPPPVYGPVVEYQYQVTGTTYTSSTVFSAGDVKRSRRWAEKICDRYQVGQAVQAYYDPAEPSQAYLLKGGRFVWRMLIAFGLLGLAFGAAFAHLTATIVPYLVVGAILLFFGTAGLLWLSRL